MFFFVFEHQSVLDVFYKIHYLPVLLSVLKCRELHVRVVYHHPHTLTIV